MNNIQSTLTAYKRNVAGRYHSISPDDIKQKLPQGACIVSEKIDGETWFLKSDGKHCVLLSPFGKSLTDITITNEAEQMLKGWQGILAGELYTSVDKGRSHVFDLHAVLAADAETKNKKLKFAVFDFLQDGKNNLQQNSFAERLDVMQALLSEHSKHLHLARFKTVESASDVVTCYEQMVTAGGAEGIVVHADDRIFKIKPEISIDAAVVAYAASDSGVSELLLALIKPHGNFQLIGRVKTGWSNLEKADLAKRLAMLDCESSYRKVNNHGTLYRFVKPELVVEVKCNDLIAVNSKNDPIRRMALQYNDKDIGWSPIAPTPAVSMINSVFRSIREDKQAIRPDVRFEQVSDIVAIPEMKVINPAMISASEIIRREVYTKRSKSRLAKSELAESRLTVRKLVAWKTNKHKSDAYSKYVIFFTDYSPARKVPLKTDLRVASTIEAINAFADDWLVNNIKRGWHSVGSKRLGNSNDNLRSNKAKPRIPESTKTGEHQRTLSIAFARSSSPTFPIIRKRLDTLAKLGSLEITCDDKGRESWFELTIGNNLVENAKRIDNLLKIVKGWKTTEVSLDGELIGKHDQQDFMTNLENTRRCWLRQKKNNGSCHLNCKLGCDALHIWASHDWLNYSGSDTQAWWTVGEFDGEKIIIDKEKLKRQLDADRHEAIRLCPNFDKDAATARIDALPDNIEADDTKAGGHWIMLYNSDGKVVWLWPENEKIPPTLRKTKDNPWRDGGMSIRLDLGLGDSDSQNTYSENQTSENDFDDRDQNGSIAKRSIPPTRYADVVGQDKVVEAVRDLIELPLKYSELFIQIGTKAKSGGIILAGPPGTGKTLLARAVAGECEAHIESVSGPELLSKWVGETEEGLRRIFERAKELAPSIILFDEIDCLAVSRGHADAQYQKTMVTQLLALLDGLEDRGNIFVIATTNRPEDIDSALRRPGRFDQTIFMGPPNQNGRAAIFLHYMKSLKLEEKINSDKNRQQLANYLATQTSRHGFTGADIAHICQRAALLCVKDACQIEPPLKEIAITKVHFEKAVQDCVLNQKGEVENKKFMFPIPSMIRQATVQSSPPAKFFRQSADRTQFQVE